MNIARHVCHDQIQYLTGHIGDANFSKMEKISIDKSGWIHFVKCKKCGQLWMVDEFDKDGKVYGVKIESIPSEAEIIIIKLCVKEKELIKVYNGYSELICSYSGCNNKALNSIKVCALHHQ